MSVFSKRAGEPPTVLAYPFRLFFLLVGVYGTLVIPAWLGLWFSGRAPGGLVPVYWHWHEMLFGWVSAAVAGFLLTAVCQWTGTAPLQGARLAWLGALWVAGRVAMALYAVLPFWLVALVDGAFFAVLSVYMAVVIVRARSTRNGLIVIILLLLTVANGLSHAALSGAWPDAARAGITLGVEGLMLLMIVIGGRITPAFTVNWLVRRGGAAERVRRSAVLDRLAIGSIVALITVDAWPGTPTAWSTGLALAAALLNGARLAGWNAWQCRREPLLWVLHLGYAWVVAALLLKGLAPKLHWPPSVWIHAAGSGAMGTLILGVMTRVALGHTGRPLVLPRGAVGIYGLITLAALLRLAAVMGGLGSWALWSAGLAWSLAFALFTVLYWPILTRPRVDGKVG